jgi:thiosulfate/3-mercaptopyruvate sulfurtransferase
MNAINPFEDLVTTQQLAEHLEDPAWVIVDCRFDLQKPSWGWQEYNQNHIRGAVYAHLDQDLAGPTSPTTGRHPLPEEAVFVALLSKWGIDDSKQVVVYDSAGGGFAVRLWWMLVYYGHSAVALLDGGYAKWTQENRPVTADIPSLAPAQFVPHAHPEYLASAADVEKIRLDPAYRLIDARAPVRFRGEQEPIDPVAGHIPGAINRFQGDNLTRQATLLPIPELKQAFESLLGPVPVENTIVYCGSGVTSCQHILAMKLAGLGMPRLYAGSWSEWIRDPSRAIAKP